MPRRQIDYKSMEPREIMKRQQQWNDYVRMRMRPEKACAKCKKTFPNDRDHFATNPAGRLLSTCITCAGHNTKGMVKPPEICPCCDNRANLVHDRTAPAPVSLCRACLSLVNQVDALSAETATRMSQYIEWRKKGNLAPMTVGGTEPPTPPASPSP